MDNASGKDKEDDDQDECLLAEGRALEHRQRFCDWDKWSKYAMLEQVFFLVFFSLVVVHGIKGPNMPW